MRVNYKNIIVLLAALIAAFQLLREPSSPQPERAPDRPPSAQRRQTPENNEALAQAFAARRSNVQVQGRGIVERVLQDDQKGSRHQRFLLRVNPDQTVLVAHNIDLAPRIENLQPGDPVSFFGEYEWNDKGGVIHWTHHDPQNRHPHGWVEHQARRYQ